MNVSVPLGGHHKAAGFRFEGDIEELFDPMPPSSQQQKLTPLDRLIV